MNDWPGNATRLRTSEDRDARAGEHKGPSEGPPCGIALTGVPILYSSEKMILHMMWLNVSPIIVPDNLDASNLLVYCNEILNLLESSNSSSSSSRRRSSCPCHAVP